MGFTCFACRPFFSFGSSAGWLADLAESRFLKKSLARASPPTFSTHRSTNRDGMDGSFDVIAILIGFKVAQQLCKFSDLGQARSLPYMPA